MTERKRPDITFESWVERQIRVAQERGDFDNLPGAGKPIPHYGDDELWWVKGASPRDVDTNSYAAEASIVDRCSNSIGQI